jgi:hypothetical protein
VPARGRGRFVAVPYAVNYREENAMFKSFDQMQITGDSLTCQGSRGHVPLN